MASSTDGKRFPYAPKTAVQELVLSTSFLEQLIKKSEDADQILMDCGRIRLQRTALAAVELYLELTRLTPSDVQVYRSRCQTCGAESTKAPVNLCPYCGGDMVGHCPPGGQKEG